METIAKSSCAKVGLNGDKSLPKCLCTATSCTAWGKPLHIHLSLSPTSVHWGKPLHNHISLQPPFRTATLTPSNNKWYFHTRGYPWRKPFGASPFDTTMGLVEADLGSWCACETVPTLVYLTCPILGSPFSSSPRAYCSGGLDPRNLILRFSADPFY